MASPSDKQYPDLLPATWLAEQMAVDPARIDAMRRGGELIAVRESGSTDWGYPGWQFHAGKPRQGVARVVATARECEIDDARLYELMTSPLGLRDGGRRLADLLVGGREDDVVAAVRAAS
jgi:hypothetical protein